MFSTGADVDVKKLEEEIRKEIEQNFGKAESRLPFRHKQIAGERSFEAAPEAFALNKGYRRDGQTVSKVVTVEHVDAGLAVGEQTVAVLAVDEFREEAEVSAQIEHARYAGSEDGV